jgi:glutamine synthetase adenylyltransferase
LTVDERVAAQGVEDGESVLGMGDKGRIELNEPFFDDIFLVFVHY